ncbi:MAG TPA: hypothetical protein VGO50_16985 [Pyrinomonadaceae bacterium]|jgi:hypothetical protein|nr:hypothetical protein [Pyrinomonadaceae bacterium]
MPGEKTSQVVFIKSRNILVRAGLLVAVLLSLWFGWYTFSREIGNMMAEVTEPTEVNAKATAYAALWMAPKDPFVNWLLATTENDSFVPEKAEASIHNFENLVRLSPHDYRWWIELGRVREQTDDPEGSERALKRSIELAPTYSYPRWQLGNFYLRQGRSDEAFVELKMAAENNVIYREQVFFTVWEFFGHDKVQLEKIVGNSAEVRAYLARFYATHDQPDDCLRAWNTLSPEEKEDNKPLALVMMQGLYERKYFRAALIFARELGKDAPDGVGMIQNGGFELPMGQMSEVAFGWQIADKDRIEIRPDSDKKHEGSQGLRIKFDAYNEPTLVNVGQIVPVEPGARYSLTFWVRTENLRSAGPPMVQIDGVNEARTFGASAPFPTGTNDWQQMKIDFTAPVDGDGVFIRTLRLYCGNNCPIVGTIWYDDFNLQKLSDGK